MKKLLALLMAGIMLVSFAACGGNGDAEETTTTPEEITTEAPANADVLCVNVNDKTIEGLKYTNKPVMTVQFIPDTVKGPNTAFLFEDFKNLIKEGK